MAIDRLGPELDALGLSGRNVRCLLFLPQVYVGWASEGRDPTALEALLDVTAARGKFQRATVDVARGWLFEQPTPAQFQSGFALLRGLQKMRDVSISSADVLESIIWASRAADLDRRRTAGGDARVTAAVRRAMYALDAWLEVDTVGLWADLLDGDGSSQSAPDDSVAAPADSGSFQGSTSGIRWRNTLDVPAHSVGSDARPFSLARRSSSRR